MNPSMRELYKNPEYCKKEYAKVRERMGTQMTRPQWKGLVRGANLLYIYCVEEYRDIVQMLLLELTKREIMMEEYGLFLEV